MGVNISVGAVVAWRRGGSLVQGTVRAVHPRPVVRRFNGVRVARVGTPEDPAYEIEQLDGSSTLKLHSELEPAT